MHQRSGLWEAVEAASNPETQIDDNRRMWRELQNWLSSWGRAILVGKNVGTFDRVFLEHAKPGITAPLSHQNLDVRTLLNAFTFWGGTNKPTLPETPPMYHRAKVDVHHDIECIGVIADWIEDASAL